MDPRLLQFYNEELSYLRVSAREFGEENKEVAAKLGLDTPSEPDPYVERLLEGVAFLAAGVKLKFADRSAAFNQSLLDAIQPSYLAPAPAMCVVTFEPALGDPSLREGPAIRRKSRLEAQTTVSATPCIFTTAHEVRLWPIEVTNVDYLATRAAVAQAAGSLGVRAEAGLKIKLKCEGGFAGLKLDSLPIYLDGSENVPGELYRQLIGDCTAIAAQTASGKGGAQWHRLPPPAALGFEDEFSALPQDARTFRGYRLLMEYFICPERFMFAEIRGLANAVSVAETEIELTFLFSRSVPALAGALAAQNVRLYATPAVNLFERQLDRTAYTPHSPEHLVMVDRTHPIDYEVYRILSVEAHRKQTPDPLTVRPLYLGPPAGSSEAPQVYYGLRREARRLSTAERRRRRRQDYIGTEIWISLAAPQDALLLDDIRELGVRAYVTNRELPVHLRLGEAASGFTLEDGGAVRSVTCVRAPTRPRPPLGLADGAWRAIAHLAAGYSALAPDDDDIGIMRELLAIYVRTDEPGGRRQLDGLLSMKSMPVTRRIARAGPPTFARGRKLEIQLDDPCYENGRMFLFCSVLEHFLAEFASVNSFTQCEFWSTAEGRIVSWSPRIGARPML
jgi:type VI secretion system VasI/ImpG family protein